MRHRPIWLAICALLLAAEARGAAAVWIDTDPSIGAPWREVDDTFALVLAFHSPELSIVGISTTYGNVGVQRATAVARDLAKRFGAPARVNESDVHAGAGAPHDIRKATPASEALARALRKERLTYVALGPLTNLASFLSLHPALADRIERVIFVGGSSPGGLPAFGSSGQLRIHDGNVVKDPESVRAVLRSGIRIELAPVETSAALFLDRSGARRLQASGPAGRFLRDKSRVWLWFWTRLAKHPGGVMFDSLAILRAACPEIVPTDRRYAHVTAAGELVVVKSRATNTRAVSFLAELKPEARDIVVERLSR